MKYLMIAIVCVALQGCIWQTANQYDIHRAVKFCGSVENVVEIQVHFLGQEFVRCMNGNSTELSRVGGN